MKKIIYIIVAFFLFLIGNNVYAITANDVEVTCIYNDGKVITKSYDVLADQLYATIGEYPVKNSKPLTYSVNKYRLLGMVETNSYCSASNCSPEVSDYNIAVAKSMLYRCNDTFGRWLLTEWDEDTSQRVNTLVYYYRASINDNYKSIGEGDEVDENNVYAYLTNDNRSGWDKFWGIGESRQPKFIDINGSSAGVSQTVQLASEQISFIKNVQPVGSQLYVHEATQASGSNKYLTISSYSKNSGNNAIIYVDDGEMITSLADFKMPSNDWWLSKYLNEQWAITYICVRPVVRELSTSGTQEYTFSNSRIDVKPVNTEFKGGDYVYSCDSGYERYRFVSSSGGSSNNQVSITQICSSIPNTTKVLVKIIGYLQWIVPALVIVYTAIDFARIVMAGNIEEELPKRKKSIIIRFIVMVVFFFLPLIIRIIFSTIYEDGELGVGGIDCLFGKLDDNMYITVDDNAIDDVE